ncbi:MAG: radical SAM protein [Thermodesulfobacteriota bacterium]
MKNVLLIQPPYKDMIHPAEAIVAPLGLAYIAAYLRENGVGVKIFDPTPLNLDMQDLGKILQNKDYDIVGITTNTPLIGKAIEIADLIKRINPTVKIIFGGLHVTALDEETLEYSKSVDIAVRADGEITMLELACELERRNPDLSKIDGITYRDGKRIRVNKPRALIENLDELPFPARDLLPMEKYHPATKMYHRLPFTTMMTSRGCPFHCIYCAYARGKTRFRSADNIVQEIEELINVYGTKDISFYDETFTANKRRILEICDLIIKKDLDITWGCYSRVNTIDRGLIEKMTTAGCKTISYGVESGSTRMLEIMKKGITLEQVERAITLTKKAGVKCSTSFVFGIPGETPKSVRKTIEFAKKIDPTFVHFNMITPWPGTELYENLVKEGKIDKGDWKNYAEKKGMHIPVIKLEGFTQRELEAIPKRAYRTFYLRPRKIFEHLSSLNSPYKVKGYFDAMKAFFKVT